MVCLNRSHAAAPFINLSSVCDSLLTELCLISAGWYVKKRNTGRKKSLISVFFVYFQKQGGRLRESVKRKERCEEAKVRQEKRLSEEKIKESFIKVRHIIFMQELFLLNNLYFSGDLIQD